MWIFVIGFIFGVGCTLLGLFLIGYFMFEYLGFGQDKQVELEYVDDGPQSADEVKIVYVKDEFADTFQQLVNRREELEKSSVEKRLNQKKVLVGSFPREFIERMTDASDEVPDQQPEEK